MKRMTIRSLLLGGLLTLSTLPALAQTKPTEDAKTRLAKAEVMFQERCKKSGNLFIALRKMSKGFFSSKFVRKETSAVNTQWMIRMAGIW